MLGNVLADLRKDGDPVATLGERLDIVLLARVHAAAAWAGEDLRTYTNRAVSRFMAEASEDEWARLIGKLRDGQPAASVSLETMLRRAAHQDGFGG
jgi:hypothetical protein